MRRRSHSQTAPMRGAPGLGVPLPIDDYSDDQASDAHHQLHPGERIGRYVIRTQLGQGGMGIVYEAYDPALGRRVALKLIHAQEFDSAELNPNPNEQLLREAHALARLSHPNVVSLYDVGHCNGGDYLVMELMPGRDIDQWQQEQPRTWREIVEVYMLAGRGLTAAHAAGIIHRDFKPKNVIVGPHHRVTVVDFGLARRAELDPTLNEAPASGSGDIHDALLATGVHGIHPVAGTRAYMAPEQLLGLWVSPRADQFSFCTALFESLYDVRPFLGDTVAETAHAFVLGQQMDPPARKGVPSAIHRILSRGLSIEPEDRFESMEALLRALDRARQPQRLKRSWGWTATLLTTAALSGSVGAWLEHQRHTRATPATKASSAPVEPSASSEAQALPPATR